MTEIKRFPAVNEDPPERARGNQDERELGDGWNRLDAAVVPAAPTNGKQQCEREEYVKMLLHRETPRMAPR